MPRYLLVSLLLAICACDSSTASSTEDLARDGHVGLYFLRPHHHDAGADAAIIPPPDAAPPPPDAAPPPPDAAPPAPPRHARCGWLVSWQTGAVQTFLANASFFDVV